MYIVKKPFLALLLSAFFFSSTAQPAVSDLVNFFKNPKTVKKMAVAGAASLGLSLLYPHIGRNAGDRCVMAFISNDAFWYWLAAQCFDITSFGYKWCH